MGGERRRKRMSFGRGGIAAWKTVFRCQSLISIYYDGKITVLKRKGKIWNKRINSIKERGKKKREIEKGKLEGYLPNSELE
jgi:hypothetical protein